MCVKNQKSKVGVFCIDKSYFLYHILGIGLELTRYESIETYFFCTPSNVPIVQKIAINYGIPNISIIKFRGEPLKFNFNKFCELIPRPLFRPYLIKFNDIHIKKMDAFIVPLYDYLILKKYYPKKSMIYTTHGMPSREYAFDNRITQFDLFFLSSLRDLTERRKRNQITNTNHKVIGFSKHDLLKYNSARPVFNNKNKTILYNPHWEKNMSSFKKFGFQILNFFSNNPEYNLIFSPHCKLVSRNLYLRYQLKKYHKFSNIIVDLHSEKNNDMTYTKQADLYMGDVSSQVLEYLFLGTKPCLFLDAHNLMSDNIQRPITWDLGDVINKLDNLKESINKAFENYNKEYKPIQIKKRNNIFYRSNKRPSKLASEAILDLLNNI